MLSRRKALPLFAAAPVFAVMPAHAQADPAAALKGGRWELRTVNGAPAAKGAGDQAPWLQFDPPRFSGFAGCNRVMGSFTINGDRFGFGPDMATTKMFCVDHMEVERRFMAALGQVREWRLTGDELALFGRPTMLVFVRTAEPARRP